MTDRSTDSAPGELPGPPSDNLPVQSTSFIGRDHELAAVGALLRREDIRLVTLTGPGGIGKTRLGLQAAAHVAGNFADGIVFVPLSDLREPELLVPAVAQAVGIMQSTNRPLISSLVEALRGRQLLLVLDNFERLIKAAQVVATLRATCPGVKFLVMSQVVLRLSAEYEYSVPPLAVPDSQLLADVATLMTYSAVALFVERARAVEPEFRLTQANALAVVTICGRLDGLPLAIELAAARTQLLSPQQLLAQLGRRLALLTGGARDVPPRQRTLRATFDWTHDLLEGGEPVLFRRLAVFVGGGTLEAIEAVCNIDSVLPWSVLDGVAALVDKSLVRRLGHAESEPRFGMLETIREYALERLAENREAETICQRHAGHYLALAEAAAAQLAGRQQPQWLARLDSEHDNLRAALRWALGRGEAETALRLAGALWRFWYLRGHVDEGRRWLEAALERRSGTAMPVLAEALNGASALATLQGDYERASVLLEASLPLVRQLGDKGQLASALNTLGQAARFRGDFEGAERYQDECLTLLKELKDSDRIPLALVNLGLVARIRGDLPRAEVLFTEALALSRAQDNTRNVAFVLSNLGSLALH
jgi:predicted ATPase